MASPPSESAFGLADKANEIVASLTEGGKAKSAGHEPPPPIDADASEKTTPQGGGRLGDVVVVGPMELGQFLRHSPDLSSADKGIRVINIDVRHPDAPLSSMPNDSGGNDKFVVFESRPLAVMGKCNDAQGSTGPDRDNFEFGRHKWLNVLDTHALQNLDAVTD
jgi:hypothetical protein